MKKLILVFIMLGFLCPASGYSQADSLKIIQKLNRLEQVTNETKVLLKKADVVEKEKQTVLQKLRVYISRLKAQTEEQQKQSFDYVAKNDAAIKAKNINEPVVELRVPDGYDTIRASFIYRLFHKTNYILKPYSIINNEKVYLD